MPSDPASHLYHEPDPLTPLDNLPDELHVSQLMRISIDDAPNTPTGWSLHMIGHHRSWNFYGDGSKERAEQWMLTNGYAPVNEKRRLWVKPGESNDET